MSSKLSAVTPFEGMILSTMGKGSWTAKRIWDALPKGIGRGLVQEALDSLYGKGYLQRFNAKNTIGY